jgi:NAD(P)H-hydrate epimerase
MSHTLEVPSISAGQMRQIVQGMASVYGISPMQTIDRTGQALARLAKRLLDDDIVDRPIVVLAGQGLKGAGGLAAARHLTGEGAWVQTILTHPQEIYQGEAAHQLTSLQALDAPLAWAEEGWELPPTDLIIDALLDSDAHGEPGDKARNLIHLANSNMAPILSLEAPSGLDATTGELATPHIQATATMTLILPKSGLLIEPGRRACGALFLADIGAPHALYTRFGFAPLPFSPRDPIIRLDVIEGKAFVAESK